jgi:hypothetical protein
VSDTAPAVEEAPTVSPPPAGEAPTDDFDKERALDTIRKQREVEKTLKAQLKELEALKAEKEQREQAELSESEKLRKQLEKLEAEHTQAQGELRKSRLLEAARSAANKAGLHFHDGALADALTLGAFDGLEFDDDGKPREMPEAVKRLAKDRPYLLKPAAVASADLDGRVKSTRQDEDAARREERRARWGIRGT